MIGKVYHFKAIFHGKMGPGSGRDPSEFWKGAISEALVYGKLTIPKLMEYGKEIPGPQESGIFKRSVGEFHGQIKDWRASVEGTEKSVHIREYLDRYELHVDSFDPYRHPVKHLAFDSPKTLLGLLGTMFLGAFLLGILRRRK
ncbi:MAG: hypothetical protein QW812_02870 [Thermoplasmataceae archaeon]